MQRITRLSTHFCQSNTLIETKRKYQQQEANYRHTLQNTVDNNDTGQMLETHKSQQQEDPRMVATIISNKFGKLMKGKNKKKAGTT